MKEQPSSSTFFISLLLNSFCLLHVLILLVPQKALMHSFSNFTFHEVHTYLCLFSR